MAQMTPASATWPLTSTSTTSVSTTGLITGSIETVKSLLINGYTGPSASQRIKVNPNWPSFLKMQMDTTYIQFAITTPANAIFHADSIALSIGANSTQSMKANIYYSTDPTFANKAQISYATGLKILASGATAPDTSYNVLSNTVLLRVKVASLGLAVTAGQTLYVRVYPWLDNSNSTSGKYVCLQNVVIGGSLESLPVDANVVWGYNPSATFINSGPIYGQAGTYSTLMKYYNKISRTILSTSVTLTSGELYPVSNSWPANSTVNDSLYFQYSCYPKTGGTLAVKAVSMYLGSRFATDLKASVYYSNDSKFTTRTLLIKDTTLNPNFIVPFNASLLNADTVHSGEVFYLRVYPHSLSAYAAGSYKMIDVDSVRISGIVSGATSDPPTIANSRISYISTTFATCGGTVSSDGGARVTARGLCWNTSANPTIANNKTSDGSGSGAFVSRVTGLTAGTTYHIRAYATNTSGTSYGGDSIFTTIAAIVVPTVTKTTASSIMTIQARAGGNATAWGGDTIKAKGVCWNTTGTPSIADSKTVNGTDLGSFTSTLYPLVQNTKYYFRAYATNSAGTGYSVVDSFTTQVPSPDVTKTVAKDGSGDYTTVQAAFTAVPTNYTGKWTIFVKPGVYYEKDTLLTGKVNVILRSIHPDSTIITYDAFADSPRPQGGGTMGTNGCQTVAIDADDFTAINITFQNTKKNIGTGNLQAVALRTNGDRQSYFNCKIMGYQDTYYAWGGSYVGRIYMKNCYIEGSVDYIFGRDVVVFDSCEMYTNRQGGAVCAPSTDAASKFGFVFRNSRLTSLAAGKIDFSSQTMVGFYLGRPWQSSPQCVYINCYEPATIYPAGWTAMSVNPLLFAEYKCFGPGSGTASRSTAATSASRQLADAEANNYTLANIFSMATNSSFGYNWKPDTTTIYKFKQKLIIADIANKTYGDKFIPTAEATSKLPITFTSSNTSVAIGGDTVKVVGLGSTIITAQQLGNYLYSAAPDSSRTLIVATKATVTAIADNKTKKYGEVNPVFTVSYTGLLNGDNIGVITAPSITATATTNSPVGDYDLTLGTDGIAINYDIVIASTKGKLTVTKATLTATADSKTKKYFDPNPDLTLSYTGFVNNETSAALTTIPSVTTTATAASSAGEYVITVGTEGAATNYNIQPVNGKLTVKKASLTVTADSKIKIYGEANPAFTLSYSGFVNSETSGVITTAPSVITTATTLSSVGNYDLTVGTNGVATNYNILPASVAGKLTITKAILTATADSKTKTYGEANPAFTVSYSGFVNSETSSIVTTAPSVTTAATETSSVGDYDLTVGTNGVATNYSIVPATTLGKLTINKANLTAQADDQTKKHGEANPVFTITYTGFVNGDTKASITEPTASSTATTSCAVGTYPITLSGGSAINYNITLSSTNGTLTVTPGTGVDKVNAAEILIYPNPASSVFSVVRKTSVPEILVILDARGQIIMEKNLTSDKTSVDISNLPKGMYIIKLQDLTYKLMVQ